MKDPESDMETACRKLLSYLSEAAGPLGPVELTERLKKEGFRESVVRQAIIMMLNDAKVLLTSDRKLGVVRADMTLRELQARAPWGDTYGKDFKASPVKHKNFEHAMVHVMKACGKLSAMVDDADHDKGVYFPKEEVEKYVADFVVCAIRMANTNPTGMIDLERAVLDRIEEKTKVRLA